MGRRGSRVRVLSAALAAGAVLGACGGGAAPTRPSPSASTPSAQAPSPSPSRSSAAPQAFDARNVRLRLEEVARGFDSPLFATGAGDGSGRLYVVEQPGRIIVLDGPGRGTFLDIRSLVRSGGERGLLGLAFHPGYAAGGRFFVNYTDRRGDTVVAEYRRSSNPGRADPDAVRRLFHIAQPYANHNGGMLAFGPDGFLYAGTGDGGSGGDPHGNGQRLDSLLGKILRIDVDRGDPYAIPQDNPFRARPGARAEIWHYGLRNPWRFSFDRATGDLWIADVGQNSEEEIDRASAGRGGINFGWNRTEGDRCYEPSRGCDRSGTARPLATYTHADGCSVTGGYVYRGSRLEVLRGGYFFADYCSGKIWAIAARDERQHPVELADTDRSISSFGEDESGELYLTDLASGDLLRLDATA